MLQTSPVFSSSQQTRPSALLSDEAFEQLFDLVALCGKRPAFTVDGELVLVDVGFCGVSRITSP